MVEENLGNQFDLNPHPRILPMLGEINLQQWRCIAELIDNSVDGFFKAARAFQPQQGAEVSVTLPLSDNPQVKITVKDNGTGMDAQTLENAVKAGWTGNDPIQNLGMFGMGFNIATARLGTLTKVWTTRAGDTEWHGLEIDFEKLQEQRHFKTPHLNRPKVSPSEHGTEVVIEKIKTDQRQWFSKAANRTQINRRLSEAYSAMLRASGNPIHFSLKINGTPIEARNHCVWGGNESNSRTVQTTRYGLVDSFQQVNRVLEPRRFCVKHWLWIGANETICPICGNDSNVQKRERSVMGWIGIQRYLSPTEFGIDFLRHGRKIEIGNKDLFKWVNDEGEEAEYPIDDPRNRGRIVGEIHLDHCRVTYMKDRFDRDDPAWEEMTRIVRGDGPLRPDKAQEMGFGENQSPLFRLFQAFRRSSPKPKVAGCYEKLLIVPDNDRAETMAKQFHQGHVDYQSDVKWWDLVKEADADLLTGVPGPPIAGPKSGDEFGGFAPDVPVGGPLAPDDSPDKGKAAEPLLRTLSESLSRQYICDITGQKWDIKAFIVEQIDTVLIDGLPWKLLANANGTHDFFVYPRHPIFMSVTMTTLDALLMELAWAACDFDRNNAAPAAFSKIISKLRDKYGKKYNLEATQLSGDANQVLTLICRTLPKSIGKNDSRDAAVLFAELSEGEQEEIRLKMAVRRIADPQKTISEGRFLEYAPKKTFLRFFERRPEFFFDGACWNDMYVGLDYQSPAATEEARNQLVRYYLSLLSDTVWLSDQDAVDLNQAGRERLLRAAMALELLAADGTFV